MMKDRALMIAMSDRWQAQTAKLLDLAIAAVMVKLGQGSIEVSEANVIEVMEGYDVVRTGIENATGQIDRWHYSVTPRAPKTR